MWEDIDFIWHNSKGYTFTRELCAWDYALALRPIDIEENPLSSWPPKQGVYLSFSFVYQSWGFVHFNCILILIKNGTVHSFGYIFLFVS